MRFDLTRAVVVFDLDDTLYPEADYVASGVRHVCARIEQVYGSDVYSSVHNALRVDPAIDWLGFACEKAGIPSAAKESLLWMYRLHSPNISLSNSCLTALKRIREVASTTAVLTDGRSVTQRLKLSALGIADWPAYISEEYGDVKPSPERFYAVERNHPAQQYFYVADNVRKDFLGCNPLGWIGIGIRGGHRNVHSQSLVDCLDSALPAHWVDGWEQLVALLFGGIGVSDDFGVGVRLE
jgi:putative hydrolase of the HAD superfamily